MLNADEIISEAENRAGIADGDVLVRNNLERPVDSLNRSSGLSAQGEEMTYHQMVAEHINRIEAQRWVRDYPKIADETSIAPLFLT